jgi:hypothetical protein
MRKTLPLVAAMALPLAACATSPYGTGYGADPVSTILGSIGTLGSGYGGHSGYGYGYGGGFSQAAAGACANYASRYGAVRITSVRQTSSDKVHVYGYVSRGFGSDDFDCSFRSDGRISDFDL